MGTDRERMGNADTPVFGAVEAGGTKFVCAVGNARGEILAETRFATGEPVATLTTMLDFLREQQANFAPYTAVGIGCFGPIELDATSPRWGYILRTPKFAWSGTDVVGPIAREFACPVGFDTDVNGAALAEHRWGAAQDVDDLVYVTVGTGIGGGVIVNGKPATGLMHPEIGHVFPRRHVLDATFKGTCPFHDDCLEGLASGTAILARSGGPLDQLAISHPQWEIEADYIGQLCALLVLTTSPRRIVIGGGVMSQTRLLPLIRDRTSHWLGGYIDRREIIAALDEYIVAPGLGSRAGVLGALALAIGAAAPAMGAPAASER
jgi:fructokinase